MPRSVVTGVAGFIGSHLAEHLVALGHEVVGIDSRIAGYSADLRSSHPRLRQRASA
jgi:UDP-glucuronate 4-epimerase